MHGQTTIYYADFEDLSGDNAWFLLGGATDGNWTIGTPNPYFTDGIEMEIPAYQGAGSLLTGTGNIQDADDGPTTAASPDILIPPGTTDLQFHFYVSYYTNATSDDQLRIELRRSSDDVTLETFVNLGGDASGQDAVWFVYNTNISAHAGETVYLWVSAVDQANPPSKVEAAVDAISIINTPPPTSGGELTCSDLTSDGFESGLGNWTDGGDDCDLIQNPANSANGNYSIRLRDNTNSSVTTSPSLDMSNSDSIKVAFNYRPISMENGEDFWLQISQNGGPFMTIRSWISGADFSNNNFYSEEVTIAGPLATDTRFRFRCDASGNGDLIFLDDIVISSCITHQIECPEVMVADPVSCANNLIDIEAVIDTGANVTTHQWTDLGIGTASGYTLLGTDSQTVSINTMGAASGTLYLAYEGVDSTCILRDTALIQILSGPQCSIVSDFDTICSSETLMLHADSSYLVIPISGMVDVSSGVGTTIDHHIIGIRDPLSAKLVITLPTWDDHFDRTLLNGHQILPKVPETASYDADGMNCQTPWIANVNGLPRSIIEMTSTSVRYFSSLTPHSTVMTEVFPTNWVTTPQPFIQGENVFRFGIENTAGPVSGSWTIEVFSNLDYTYLWSTGDTKSTIEVSPTTTTTYTLTITSPAGCSSTCSKTITVEQGTVENITYQGCSGDGYGVEINGILYDESNPTDTLIVSTSAGCDSIYYINLEFGDLVVVDAGTQGASLCSNSTLTLADLGASISGGVSTGIWYTSGGGTFDNGGLFGTADPATIYTPDTSDIAAGQVILTLSSDAPPTTCDPAADAVIIMIQDVTCSEFPWAGGN